MSPIRKLLAITFLLLAASGVAVLMFHMVTGQHEEPQHATVLPATTALPPFALLDQDGNRFTQSDFAGDWSLVFFGFTHCPDICPATLQQLTIAKARLEEAGADFPRIVFVSVDPERDTPQKMAAYVAHFGAGIVGLTGDLEELRKLTAPLGIYFAKSGEETDNYSVDHAAVVLLINREAEWTALFSAPHSVEAFVDDLPILTGG
jgi:protein SCO1/2